MCRCSLGPMMKGCLCSNCCCGCLAVKWAFKLYFHTNALQPAGHTSRWLLQADLSCSHGLLLNFLYAGHPSGGPGWFLAVRCGVHAVPPQKPHASLPTCCCKMWWWWWWCCCWRGWWWPCTGACMQLHGGCCWCGARLEEALQALLAMLGSLACVPLLLACCYVLVPVASIVTLLKAVWAL